jgi:dinuclear metal center YbgI/SA1388 family protein
VGSIRVRSSKIKSRTLAEVCAAIEERAPLATAAGFDHVGLMLGDLDSRIDSAVVSIDLTEESLERAVAKKSKLIITHHPPIFPASKGIKRLIASKREADLGGRLMRAARAGVAVYSCHSNFDVCGVEALYALATALKVSPHSRLFDDESASLLKLVVFVPMTHLQKLSQALFSAGAGHIGHYSECAFSVQGEGTFRGDSRTRPFIGKSGELEQAREVRFETIFPKGLRRKVLSTMRSAHPYEEIAYDLYALEQGASPGGVIAGLGYGIVADVDQPQAAFLKRVKAAFGVKQVLASSSMPKRFKRMGFVAGKGSSFIRSAAAQGCDVFVTGEAGFHSVIEAERLGVSVIEVGHRQSERFFLSTMSGWIQKLGMRAVTAESQAQSIF